MSLQEREAILKYHPDFKEDGRTEILVGPSKGYRIAKEMVRPPPRQEPPRSGHRRPRPGRLRDRRSRHRRRRRGSVGGPPRPGERRPRPHGDEAAHRRRQHDDGRGRHPGRDQDREGLPLLPLPRRHGRRPFQERSRARRGAGRRGARASWPGWRSWGRCSPSTRTGGSRPCTAAARRASACTTPATSPAPRSCGPSATRSRTTPTTSRSWSSRRPSSSSSTSSGACAGAVLYNLETEEYFVVQAKADDPGHGRVGPAPHPGLHDHEPLRRDRRRAHPGLPGRRAAPLPPHRPVPPDRGRLPRAGRRACSSRRRSAAPGPTSSTSTASSSSTSASRATSRPRPSSGSAWSGARASRRRRGSSASGSTRR